ncbi:hypothetical protein [Bradyrhizobium sp. Ash2021]|uniref:hypothetical protein n=1 Tax=Bradyrhizobium sp. Ash2021 TaxID=2954771 RepID=UPI0028169DB3|nr:hypothetical protein [Bradyrhizobium sp. Ash2021]WMT75076.1 hypothetical protein NL528_01130 [Bradyrhizobium sp. Ash2021]
MTVTSREGQLVTDNSHNLPKFSRALGAELALIKIIERDRIVLAEREAAEETIWHDEAREKMRERALAREAARRKLKNSNHAAVPGSSRRTDHDPTQHR